jgi:hypothetical protein
MMVGDGDECGAVGGIKDWQGNPKYSEKPWPRAALSNTEPKSHELGSKPGRRVVNPETNRATERHSSGAGQNTSIVAV